MDPQLQAVWNVFRPELHQHMQARYQAEPGEQERIEKQLIYHALVSLRATLAGEFGGPAFFRCHAGEAPGVEDPAIPCPDYGWDMKEYMLDFSFSRYSIPQVQGRHAAMPDWPAEARFELLLAVESEMGTLHEVTRDLLKLLTVRSRVKWLLYRARVGEEDIPEIRTAIRDTLRRHANYDPQEKWLIIGVPSPHRWHAAGGDLGQMTKQLYTVISNNGVPDLQDLNW